ncbi:MAG: CidA/LrgA family protein [Beijerinckiaceae bacterium]|jgi:holin-like protein|nr:CidA/LrgA family protein [Beijerinckiaceae bacterium]MDO9439435.1 CidA/LrgA family protein [Beijerinckiaceae bacterium]
MIVSLGLLLVCQLLGEIVARASGLPIPGPVLGMALMLALLLARDHLAPVIPAEVRDGALERTSNAILANLSLLFVPAGVGVVQKLDLVAAHGAALLVALVVSTVLALLVTVATFRLIARWTGDAS